MRINCKPGEHKVMVIMKGSAEYQHRWFAQIEAKTALLGIESHKFIELSTDDRKK